MIKAYCRCNSGHYFVGESCPLDGWSSAASTELTNAVERIINSEQKISVAALREVGVSEATLKRTVVVEFGSDTAVFDAISPDGYFVNEKLIKSRNFDQRFL